MAEDSTIGDLPQIPSVTGAAEIATERSGSNYKVTIDEVKAFVLEDVPSSGVETVTGDGVDNTDPDNPVMTFPTPIDIGALEDASNGLTNNNGVAELGGTLTKDTVIGDYLADQSLDIRSGFDTNVGVAETTIFVGSTALSAKVKTSSILFDTDNEAVISMGESIGLTSEDKKNEVKGVVDVKPDSVVVGQTNIVTSEVNKIILSEAGVVLTLGSGNGMSFNDRATDEANVPAWGSADNHLSSEARLIENLPSKAEVDLNTAKGVCNVYESNILTFVNTTADYFGKYGTARTGALTSDLTGAVTGAITVVYYNNATLDLDFTPTKTFGDEFTPSVLQKLFFERDVDGNIFLNIVDLS